MALKRALVITAATRPDLFRQTMESWSNVRGFFDWEVIVRLEPTATLGQHVDIAKSLNHPNLRIVINDYVYGVLHHPWRAFDDLFTMGRFDFVVRAEDDLLVSDDILEYFEWASETYVDDSEIGTVLAFTLNEGDASLAERVSSFNPWVWGTWWNRWASHYRDTWDHDYSTFNGYPGNQSGWDWNIETRVHPEKRLKSIRPLSSRVQNIGVWGVHGTPENFQESPSFRSSYRRTSYQER